MKVAAVGLITLAMIGATPRSAANAPAVLTVEGAPATLRLTAADIAAMPHSTVSWTVHGNTLTCEGPWLTDVLARAGVAGGEAVRGKLLSTVVVATGRDGYRTVFTVGEIDHKLGNAPIIVADRCGGVALADTDGPFRIVAASDQRGARSVRQLSRLTVAEFPTSSTPN